MRFGSCEFTRSGAVLLVAVVSLVCIIKSNKENYVKISRVKFDRLRVRGYGVSIRMIAFY